MVTSAHAKVSCQAIALILIAVISASMLFGGVSWCVCCCIQAACVGPGRAGSLERLQSAWKRAHGQFAKDYNDRLFTGLLVSSLVVIVVFRFLIKSQFLEAGGWFALVFLELYPRLYPGPGGMYDTAWWKVTTQVWELCMYALFGFQGAPLLWVLLGAAVYFIWRRVKRRDLRKKFKQTAGDLRDLDV